MFYVWLYANPVGYDRLRRLYICIIHTSTVQESSSAWRPLVVPFCAVSPRLIHDMTFGDFPLLTLILHCTDSRGFFFDKANYSTLQVNLPD